MRNRIIVAILITVAWVTTAWTAEPELKTDDEKTLYAIGIALSQSLTPLSLTPDEINLVKAGFADGASNAEPKVSLETYGPKINQLGKARVAKTLEAEKKIAKDFLEKAASAKGAEKKPSGLIYTEIKAGDGNQVTASDKVKVHYTGTLRDGTVFDSSIERGKPAEFAIHGVIPCWTEGLQLMKEHGKAKLVCPSELAYSDRGMLPKIKPGAALTFEVELLEVTPVDMKSLEAPHPEESQKTE